MSRYGPILGGAFLGAAMIALPLSASAQDDASTQSKTDSQKQASAEGQQWDCTITLGAALSFTGQYSVLGLHTKRGYDFAVDRINDQGGVQVGDQTCKFEVKYYDDESTPARAAQLAERLIQQDDIKYMLGPYGSALTTAVAPVTEQYQIPFLQAEAASRSLFNKGYDYMFGIISTSENYLAPAVELAAMEAENHDEDPSSVDVAMAYQNDPFSLDVRAGVVDQIEKYDMNVVIDAKLPRNLTDMSATLIKVKALDPDLLLVSGHSKGAATAFRQIGEMGVHVPMVGITHCVSGKAIEDYGKVANGVLCPTQWAETLTYKGPIFGSASDYADALKKAYPVYQGAPVPYQTAEASAALVVYKNAFERADSFDKEAIRDALAKTEMTTFYSPVKFGPTGKNVAKSMVMYQIQDGEYVVVYPPKYADGELVYPRP